jgi:hypothetical protein
LLPDERNQAAQHGRLEIILEAIDLHLGQAVTRQRLITRIPVPAWDQIHKVKQVIVLR